MWARVHLWHHLWFRCSCLQHQDVLIQHVRMRVSPLLNKSRRKPRWNNRRNCFWTRSCSSMNRWFEWWRLVQTCLQRWMTTPQVNVDENVPRRLTFGPKTKSAWQMCQRHCGQMHLWTNRLQFQKVEFTSWPMKLRLAGCFRWMYFRNTRIQCWSQHGLCMSGARRVTKVEVRRGWEGVVLWLVSLQMKNTVTPMLQLQRAIQPVGSPWSISTCWEKSLRAYATMMLTRVALYQRCVPSSPSASDHWCDTLQHQILSFSQFAGAALRVRVPGIGTLETMCRRRWIAVGARNNLLFEGAQWMVYTTPSWYTSTTSWFFFPGSFLLLQVSHCCPTAPESKMTKSKEENPKRKVLPWFLDQQISFSHDFQNSTWTTIRWKRLAIAYVSSKQLGQSFKRLDDCAW